MRLDIRALVLVTLLSLFHTSVADAVPCAAGAIAMDVSSPAELQIMTDTINCTGQGSFDVTWIGSVLLGHEIELSDNKTLSITGSSSSSVVLQGAEIDAANTSGIFSVYDGSTLRLNNLVLKGGNSEVGGGIHVHSSSSVYVAGCSFTNNNASTGGAIYANQSEVHIDGETLFLNNLAASDRGGAIYAQESDIYINGNTSFVENSAAFVGGAICAINTGVQVDGNTSFVNNSADGNAGGIYAEQGQVKFNGNTYFGNSLGRIGGAFFLSNCSASFNDNTVFGHNSATRDGGAIHAEEGSQIQFDGQTSFGNNSANNGGVFSVARSELFFGSKTSFADNSCIGSGAVIYGSGSEINITGETNFTRNSAGFDGGIMHVLGSTNVNITGKTVCDQNSALNSGGGIYTTQTVTLYMDGDTSFTRNVAGVNGGALNSFPDSTIQIGGTTTFVENVAKWRGGAIYGSGVTYRINGTTLFSENLAYDGGAISARESDVLIGGNTTFSNNSASHDGGAINVLGSNIIMDGDLEFSSNTALNGGGIFIFVCPTVHISGRASFGENSAVLVGGAMSITDSVNGSIIGSSFVSNEAESGGAVSLASTLGAAAGFEGCQFDSNTATNGGALHLTSGDAAESEKTHFVRDSVFRHNLAYESGGALFNIGPLKINDTVFSANTAKDNGLAIMNAEAPLELWNAFFHGNALICDPEEYLDFDHDSEGSCRFEVVCQQCLELEECQVDPRFSTITNTSVPSCEAVPLGVSTLSTTTLATFDLMPGHYRISAYSRDILKCYRFDSCIGGTNALNYCDTGYAGPYCAVCADGFTPGVWRRCHECSTKTKRLATGLAASIVILLGAFTAWLVPRPRHGRIGARVRIRQAISSFYKLIMEVFPLSAIKIVVVVLQIVTQFTEIAGAVFPAEYEAFLSKMMPESIDIGVFLQNFCIVATDFYHRLLISTLGPLLVLSVLSVVSYAMNKIAHNETSAEVANPTARRKLLSTGLFILFFVYSSVSFTIFQTFVCEDLDDGNSYLRADYSITCLTEKHNAYRIYAGVMVFVYPVGIPAFYGCWLARNRRNLKTAEGRDAGHLQPFRGLWAAYKPSCYYYEVVECSRRIVLTGAAVFILPNTPDQIAAVLILSVVFMFVSESLSPFKLKHDMWLYRWGNGIILGSMYVAFLMKVELTGEDSRTAFVMSALLIAANAFMVAAILVHAGLLVNRIYLSRRRARVV